MLARMDFFLLFVNELSDFQISVLISNIVNVIDKTHTCKKLFGGPQIFF